ncbi:MAG: hypothetical protein KGN84_08515 [Acidobacteriota bacterium]|nr:hypothetical protein [Acidobacteriota bacterium]
MRVDLSAADWELGLGALAVAAGGLGLFLALRKRPDAGEIERRRRAHINLHGKVGDCEILDVDGCILHYSYSVSGVIYTAGQDASPLAPSLPEDRMMLIGPALLKYDPRNPANSIVLCEAWSGLPKKQSW